jgi:hypothetical protein
MFQVITSVELKLMPTSMIVVSHSRVPSSASRVLAVEADSPRYQSTVLCTECTGARTVIVVSDVAVDQNPSN